MSKNAIPEKTIWQVTLRRRNHRSGSTWCETYGQAHSTRQEALQAALRFLRDTEAAKYLMHNGPLQVYIDFIVDSARTPSLGGLVQTLNLWNEKQLGLIAKQTYDTCEVFVEPLVVPA